MEESKRATNFIEEFVEEYLSFGNTTIKTRFPPEPNGYLHIGHAKALAIDFGVAEKYGGVCNLRFDDTNPAKEDVEYVDAILEDIRWLGFAWDKLLFGSSYFEACYELAVKLIKKGVAYVDDLTREELRAYRGTLTEPGRNSPYRNRSVEENLDLFARMRAGEFPNGSRTLRAKIDMASPNINMRDPAMYRILHLPHHQTGDAWCIYPMYDFAHPIQDALEGITHSLCSLEYEAHRPLYDWVTEQCEFHPRPRQIEFARLNITDTVMSKRYLRRLVEEGHVQGWDDPRMPTLCAMRRRGYPAAAVRDFLARIGVAKADSIVDAGVLEHCVRENLNENAARAVIVTEPLKLVLTNWGEGSENIEMENHPFRPELGSRTLRFGRELWIEKSDFAAIPPPKYFRLKPEGEVRLKNAYIIKYQGHEVDENGEVTCVYATVDMASKSGGEGANRKVKGTIHWLSAADAAPCELRHFEPLMRRVNADMAEDDATDETVAPDFTDSLNPASLRVLSALCEPALLAAAPGSVVQGMRMAYYCKDRDSRADLPVLNRTVGLKDSFRVAL
ncbi:MAG: glutamine--tRNA ligase/YqeY domain fusion protein [Clostridiales bacterium]|nr:glutamine--tRNA ligase/YqeY domain fusion protein [Clostridiales bacterium]